MTKEKTILNIGCGIKKRKGAINIDKKEWFKPDMVIDVEEGIPFDDNYFDEVEADHVLHQICDNESFVFVMNEIWRVLKPAGIIRIRVPNAEFGESFRDPMDCRRFTSETFDHFKVNHYRWFALGYGFKPWHKISVNAHRINRLSVRMTPYKDKPRKGYA